MKFIITVILLSSTSFVFAQSNDVGSRNTKIADSEKKRLENEFKALGTFYIDDSGLVVYQKQKEELSTSTPEHESANVPVITEKSKEEPIYSNSRERTESTQTVKGTSQNSIFVKKEVSSNVVDYEKDNIERQPIGKGETEGRNSLQDQMDQLPVPEKQKPKAAPTKSSTGSNNGSILNRKRESQYKTMEEAALAVEALLEDLKKEQGQITGSSNSMSSKLSKGVSKSLKKNSGSVGNIVGDYQPNTTTPSSQKESLIDDADSKFSTEPSYFINGKEVDKLEINKLRKKDIINKEVRIRNTVSGNPNGEIWYEVKE